MNEGYSASEARALREIFTPSFEGTFSLGCPLLDDSVARLLRRAKNTTVIFVTSKKKFDRLRSIRCWTLPVP